VGYTEDIDWGEKCGDCNIMGTGCGALVVLCRGTLPIMTAMSNVKFSPQGTIADTLKKYSMLMIPLDLSVGLI